jgi:hypothetical protein
VFELQSMNCPSAPSTLTIVLPYTDLYFNRFPLRLPFMLSIIIDNALDQCVAGLLCDLEVLGSYLGQNTDYFE